MDWGPWVAQSVKHLPLFGSGHDLTILRFEPQIGLCADSVDPPWDLSLSLSLFFSLSFSLSLPLPTCAFSLS